jgi:beta-mannosidase
VNQGDIHYWWVWAAGRDF